MVFSCYFAGDDNQPISNMKYPVVLICFLLIPCLGFSQEATIFSLENENHNFGQTQLEWDLMPVTDAYFERTFREGGIYEEAALEEYLDSLIQHIYPDDLPRDLVPSLSIIRDPEFVMEPFADGRAIISTGLLANCEYEGEIAFALAYILAEHILRHPLRKHQFWNERIVNLQVNASKRTVTRWMREATDHEYSLVWEADSLATKMLQAAGYDLIGGASLIGKYPTQIRENPPQFLVSLFGGRILGFRRPFKEDRVAAVLRQRNSAVVNARIAIGNRLNELRQDLFRQFGFRPTYLTLLQLDSLENRLSSASTCTKERYDLAKAEVYYYLLKQENHLAFYRSCRTNIGETYRKAYGPGKWREARALFSVEFGNYILGLENQNLNCSDLEARRLRILGLYQYRHGDTTLAKELVDAALAAQESEDFPLLDRRALSELSGVDDAVYQHHLSILPFVVDFRLITDISRLRSDYYYRGDYILYETAHEDEDVLYDLSFSPKVQEVFIREMRSQDLLKDVPILSYDEMSIEEGRLFWEAYLLSFRNVYPWHSPRRQLFGDFGPEHEMILQPELFNNLADRLNSRYLAFFTINGTHYLRQSEEEEGIPEMPRGGLKFAVWIVDGTTGELVFASHTPRGRRRDGTVNNSPSAFRAINTISGLDRKKMTDRRLEDWSEDAIEYFVRRLKRKDYLER